MEENRCRRRALYHEETGRESRRCKTEQEGVDRRGRGRPMGNRCKAALCQFMCKTKRNALKIHRDWCKVVVVRGDGGGAGPK